MYGPAIALAVSVFASGTLREPRVLVALFASYALFLAAYEIGLLVNDLVSARFETHPTIRVEPQPPAVVFLAIAIRFIFGVFIYVLAVVALPEYATYFTNVYVPVLFVLLVVYAVHNSIHVISMYGRLITFTFLRLFRWFAPILFLFVALDTMYQMFLGALFIGMHTYYLYDYAATKRLIHRFLEEALPRDLEARLMLFSAVPLFCIIIYYGKAAVWFAVFVLGYLSVLFIARHIVRTRRV
ncbi:MAG: hypothetical protein Q8P16_00105 [bacterium]|nr:hypothetical protein [bacterium]